MNEIDLTDYSMRTSKWNQAIKFLIPAIAVNFLYSCSNDNEVYMFTTSSGLTNLSGRIENWNLGDSLKLRAEIFSLFLVDTSSIDADGSFSVKLKPVPDNFLTQTKISCDSGCICNVTINPGNTRGSSQISFNIYQSDTDLFPIGYMYRVNEGKDTNIKPGDFTLEYVYLNQNVSITGNRICNHGQYRDSILYNYSGVTGWNKVVSLILSRSSYSSKTSITANEPPGGRWFSSLTQNNRLFKRQNKLIK